MQKTQAEGECFLRISRLRSRSSSWFAVDLPSSSETQGQIVARGEVGTGEEKSRANGKDPGSRP